MMQKVVIIGVGLIGGSFGLGLKSRGFTGRIAGVGRRVTLEKALARGAIDEAFEELGPALAGADLVLLAAPIMAILDLLERVRKGVPEGALVTDVGSTKSQIVERAAALYGDAPIFIGGHPMAGREKQGIEAAQADLFVGAPYVLTPWRITHLETAPAREFIHWIERLGALPVVMDAELHDQIVSWTSHLPQLAATALAATVAESLADLEDLRLSAGGLRDTTRLAESPYRVWRDICLTNTENLEAALSALIQKLEHLRENLRTRALEEEFRRARDLRARLSGNSSPE